MSLFLACHRTLLITYNQQTWLSLKSLKHWRRLESWIITRESGSRKLEWALLILLSFKAWAKSATSSNVQTGSGIFPFNPTKIKIRLFAPSKTTEQTEEDSEEDALLPAPPSSHHLGLHSRHDVVHLAIQPPHQFPPNPLSSYIIQ